MAKSIIKNSRKVHAGPSTDPSLDNRVYYLENNEYKITYYEVVSGASGTLTVPTAATINEGEFGSSGNAILSEIDVNQKPTFKSPQTAGGVIVTANLNTTTGTWLASGVYTSVNVALIYSVSILAKDYQNLNYDRIVESEELDYEIATQAAVDTGTVNDQIVTPKTFFNSSKWNTKKDNFSENTGFNLPLGTTSGTVLEGNRITQTITAGVTDKTPSENAVYNALITKADLTTPMIVFSPIKLNTTISHTGTTNETKLYSVLIPAGTMKANDILEYYALAIPGTGSGNKTLKVYLNTSNAIGGIQIATYKFTTTSSIFKRKLTFKNSLSTQEIIPAGATSIGNFELSNYAYSNVSSIAANFNNDVWFVISMTLSTASNNVSIYSIGSNILR